MRVLINLAFITIFLTPISLWADHYEFVTLEFPPLEFVNSDGEVTGIAVDIVKTVMTNLGHTVNIKIYPWARALVMTKVGSADAIFTAYKTPEREKFLDYSQNVLIHQTVSLYTKNDSDIVFSGNLETLKNYKIGIVSTISYGTKFNSIRDQLQLTRVEDLISNFKLLNSNITDLVISSTFIGDYTLIREDIQNRFKKIPLPIQSVDSFIAFSKVKKLSDLRDDFDKELAKLIANGTYDEMLNICGKKK